MLNRVYTHVMDPKYVRILVLIKYTLYTYAMYLYIKVQNCEFLELENSEYDGCDDD